MSSILNKQLLCFKTIFKRSLNENNKCIKFMTNSSESTEERVKTIEERVEKSDNNFNDINNKSNDYMKHNIKHNIFSYLYISPRFASIVYNVLQPKYDFKYLNKIKDNLNAIKDNLIKRNIDLDFDSNLMSQQMKQLIDLKTQLDPKIQLRHKVLHKIDVKTKKNKTVSQDLRQQLSQLNEDIKQLNQRVYDLEEVVIKFVVNIPNDIKDDVKQDIEVISSYEPKTGHQLRKHLNYIQLSYYNKCLFQSIVGPKSCYLMAITAQINDSLIEYFGQSLREKQFIDISGIDFVKTAVIESTHYKELIDYKRDKLKIKSKAFESLNDHLNQSLHFVGNSSFESICGFISKRQFNWTSNSIRLLSIGQQFEQNFTQNNSMNATIVTKESNDLSDNEMKFLYQLLWNCFTRLDLKCRSVRTSAQQLERSQYSGIDIEVWLQSQSRWLPAIQITHYKDYISVRTGAPDSHIINASIDLFSILIAIIEGKQTIDGKLEIPDILKQFLF